MCFKCHASPFTRKLCKFVWRLHLALSIAIFCRLANPLQIWLSSAHMRLCGCAAWFCLSSRAPREHVLCPAWGLPSARCCARGNGAQQGPATPEAGSSQTVNIAPWRRLRLLTFMVLFLLWRLFHSASTAPQEALLTGTQVSGLFVEPPALSADAAQDDGHAAFP